MPSPAPPPPQEARPRRSLARGVNLGAGLVLVGVGGVGMVVPGLPTTVFFIGAAACFARSSPRLERWVLGLPGVGPMVRDYRAGLGMPRRAKAFALTAIAGATALSVAAIPSGAGRAAAVALAVVGLWYVGLRVPTRERVLAARREDAGA